MDSCELITAISALACTISKALPPEELATLACIFTQLGDSIATIIANEELYNNE